MVAEAAQPITGIDADLDALGLGAVAEALDRRPHRAGDVDLALIKARAPPLQA